MKPLFLWQSSSEHPLAKAILEYARHFHFFNEPSAAADAKSNGLESKSFEWLHDVSGFSSLSGKGVQCFIGGKKILVSVLRQSNLSPNERENFICSIYAHAKVVPIYNRLVTGSS